MPSVMPRGALTAATYVALGLEILHVPLALFDSTRKHLWSSTMFMHLCILVTLDIPVVSVTMLGIHLFLYDHRWGFHRTLLGYPRTISRSIRRSTRLLRDRPAA